MKKFKVTIVQVFEVEVPDGFDGSAAKQFALDMYDSGRGTLQSTTAKAEAVAR